MSTTLKVGQLINYCEDEAVSKKFYPVSLLQAIYDARTGVRADRILAFVNSVYLPYRGSFGETVAQVPLEARRAGLIVTYKDYSGIINTVRYRATNVTVNDESWEDKANWEGWTFDSVIEDLAAALEVIFNDIDSYPTFKQYLEETLTVLVKEYVDNDEVKAAFGEALEEQIIAAVKDKVTEIMGNACDYEDIVSIIHDAALEAANAVFDNIESHLELRDTILNHVESLMTTKIVEAINDLFSNLEDNDNVIEIVKSAVDNKIHDVFYNVLEYKDVADIIRSEWQAKLGTLEEDSELSALINTLVQEYLQKFFTDEETYPEIHSLLARMVCESTKCVFQNVSKYAELVGVIESNMHSILEAMVEDIAAHTSLVNVIDTSVRQYVCAEFKTLNPNSGLGLLIYSTISETITNIFNNLDDYPEFKVKFDVLVKEQFEDVLTNIDNYPNVKWYIEQVARNNRTKFVSFTSDRSYTVDELNALKGRFIDSLPVEEVYAESYQAGDVAIIEVGVTDNAHSLRGVVVGYIYDINDNGTLDIYVEAVINPIDSRIANLINALLFNPDGTYNNPDNELVAGCANAGDLINRILGLIESLQTSYDEIKESVQTNDDNALHKEDVGTIVPELDNDGYVKDEFINNKYQNVHYGQYVDETTFIDDSDNSTIEPKTDCIYVDISDATEYYWDKAESKYKRLNEPIKIGTDYGEAFEGYRGKHLEDVALSLPKNIVSDIEQAKRYQGFVQIKYRSRTKTDHQTYSESFDRICNLYPATEELAGVMLPEDKYRVNHIEDIIKQFIEDNADWIRDTIGAAVEVPVDPTTHRVSIPDGYSVVRVSTTGLTPVDESQTAVCIVEDENATEDQIIEGDENPLDIPNGYSPVITNN